VSVKNCLDFPAQKADSSFYGSRNHGDKKYLDRSPASAETETLSRMLQAHFLEARVGFEPTNGGFADPSWISILLARLALRPRTYLILALIWGQLFLSCSQLVVNTKFTSFGRGFDFHRPLHNSR
jgi:hypothetical protein